MQDSNANANSTSAVGSVCILNFAFALPMKKPITSKKLFALASTILPGGVDSPVRAFQAVGATPIFISRASGARIRDVDGNTYIDYVMSWGPLIHGHAPRGLVRAISAAAKNGTSFGAPSALEHELGARVRTLMPSLERVRFVSSGTEAAMSAIRVARAFTNRSRIIKFAGCYHGHADAFLVKAGSGALTLGIPTSPGVTPSVAEDTLIARYNDLVSVDALIQEHGSSIAAVIVEPIAGNIGVVPPADGFLRGLRDRCTANGSLLIFDEVISGFRAAAGRRAGDLRHRARSHMSGKDHLAAGFRWAPMAGVQTSCRWSRRRAGLPGGPRSPESGRDDRPDSGRCSGCCRACTKDLARRGSHARRGTRLQRGDASVPLQVNAFRLAGDAVLHERARTRLRVGRAVEHDRLRDVLQRHAGARHLPRRPHSLKRGFCRLRTLIGTSRKRSRLRTAR
jgi:hypothetical protein